MSAVTAASTWAPFVARGTPPQLRFVLGSAVDVVGNLLLLVPIAVVIGLMVPGGEARRVTWTMALAALVGILLEAGQLLVRGRIVSVWDPPLNVLGAGFASWLSLRLRGWGVRPRTLMTTVAVATFFMVAGHMFVSAHRVRRAFRIVDWNSRFPVVVGRESGGLRVYEGTIQAPKICAGREPAPICLVGEDTGDRRRALIAEARTTQIVELSARVQAAHDTLAGPARIITFSSSPALRNATLGQEGRALVFRVRTTLTGENGGRPQFVLPGAVDAGVTTAVRGEFARGAVRLASRTDSRSLDATFRFGVLESWIPVSFGQVRDLTPPILRRAMLSGTVVLLMPLGLGLGFLFRFRRRGFLDLVIPGMIAAGVLFGLERTWIGIPWSPVRHLLLPVGVVWLGGALTRYGHSRPPGRAGEGGRAK